MSSPGPVHASVPGTTAQLDAAEEGRAPRDARGRVQDPAGEAESARLEAARLAALEREREVEEHTRREEERRRQEEEEHRRQEEERRRQEEERRRREEERRRQEEEERRRQEEEERRRQVEEERRRQEEEERRRQEEEERRRQEEEERRRQEEEARLKAEEEERQQRRAAYFQGRHAKWTPGRFCWNVVTGELVSKDPGDAPEASVPLPSDYDGHDVDDDDGGRGDADAGGYADRLRFLDREGRESDIDVSAREYDMQRDYTAAADRVYFHSRHRRYHTLRLPTDLGWVCFSGEHAAALADDAEATPFSPFRVPAASRAGLGWD